MNFRPPFWRRVYSQSHQNGESAMSTMVFTWADLGEGLRGPRAPPFFFLVFSKCFTTNATILLRKSFYEMLFNSIFRNVNVTLLCITNTLTMLYAACPEKGSFHSGGEVGDSAPFLSIFWIRLWLSYLATLDKLRAWRRKMFNIFHFLQCSTVCGIQ